jgi:hypothetical protein
MNAPILINGHHPVTASDVENALEIAHSQIETMAALFRSIAKTIKDRDLVILCKHGSCQAEEVANDLDELRERAEKAGVVGEQ